MPYELFRTSYSHNSTQYSHIVKLTLHFYAHIWKKYEEELRGEKTRLDSSGKISQISVASLKFMIMIQMCRDDDKWDFVQIQKHQKKMLEILCDK